MPHLTLYLDECVNYKVVPYLRARGVLLTTARDEGMNGEADDAQLRFAHIQGWVTLTNDRGHFLRWHRDFLAREEPHSGIISVPQDDAVPVRFFVRSAMLIAWVVGKRAETANSLFRWNDLQRLLQQGYRVAGFTSSDVALALGLS